MQATKDFQFFRVGGIVRDGLLGVPCHDLDLTVVGAASFQDMQDRLTADGNDIVKVNDGTFTCVTLFSDAFAARFGERKADIVMARIDGPSSDGRHPDWVRPGTLLDDQNRRDFTVNSLATSESGELFDPHGGQADLEAGVLRFVGDPMTRVREDALRVLRALRFAAVKGLEMTDETWAAVNSDEAADLLASLPVERVDSEVTRMLSADPVAGMRLLVAADKLHRAVFRDGFHVTGSLKVRKVAQ